MPELYQVPRYLGLERLSETPNGQFVLTLGFSDGMSTEIEVDRNTLRLIETCFKPQSPKTLSKKLNQPASIITKICRQLKSIGVLVSPVAVNQSLKRYDRHLLFFQMSGTHPVECQERLGKSRVALIGMGGIGNWTSLNLIGAGLKELRLIDFDTIELSNLTRQVLFDEDSVGLKKVDVAEKVLKPKNRQTKVTKVKLRVDGVESLTKALKNIDFVILSADRPAQIHDWVDAVCIKKNIPYLNVGYRDGLGVVGPMTLKGKTSCYQCFKPKSKTISDMGAPTKESKTIFDRFDNNYQAPSFGPLNSIISSLGAVEALKYLGKFGTCESFGQELTFDPLTFELKGNHYKRDKKCWHCGKIKN